MNWIYLVDLFGTFVFAVSGVSTALQKRFDLVGTLVIGFVTAIGGGTIRDVLVGRTPVGWITDRNYFLVIIVAYVFTYLFNDYFSRFRKSFFIFDTIGIGLFTVLGIQIGLRHELNIEICLIFGVVSACFGGIVRDVLSNEVPLIFRREVYATACFAGGVIYLVLNYFGFHEDLNILLSIISVIVIRTLAIRYNWSVCFTPKST